VRLSAAARHLLESDALGHLATVNPDGSPQVAVVWVGLEGDEIVSGHLDVRQKKLRNLQRDPRVALTVESAVTNPMGLREHLVVHGRARLTDGGAPELLQRLARTYLGPDVRFPPMDDPPPGVVVRIAVERVGGVGDWIEPDDGR
jgi:PPOX class probable F420-dependent enzyme